MFEFHLFRIPIRVEPWFWLTAFFVGGGLQLRLNNREDLLRVLLGMIVVFVSILVHELGHALTSRKLTGRDPAIKLWAMGGLAYPNASLSRKESFWVTWAGPLAGLGLFALTFIATMIFYGPAIGANIIQFFALPGGGLTKAAFEAYKETHWALITIIYAMVLVNLWWSLINLLPVFPLDGGQIYASIEKSPVKVVKVGAVTGLIVAIVAAVVLKQFFMAALFGYLAYQNYQRLQQLSGPRG